MKWLLGLALLGAAACGYAEASRHQKHSNNARRHGAGRGQHHQQNRHRFSARTPHDLYYQQSYDSQEDANGAGYGGYHAPKWTSYRSYQGYQGYQGYQDDYQGYQDDYQEQKTTSRGQAYRAADAPKIAAATPARRSQAVKQSAAKQDSTPTHVTPEPARPVAVRVDLPKTAQDALKFEQEAAQRKAKNPSSASVDSPAASPTTAAPKTATTNTAAPKTATPKTATPETITETEATNPSDPGPVTQQGAPAKVPDTPQSAPGPAVRAVPPTPPVSAAADTDRHTPTGQSSTGGSAAGSSSPGSSPSPAGPSPDPPSNSATLMGVPPVSILLLAQLMH